MKLKKYFISAMAVLAMGAMVGCSQKTEQKKTETKVEEKKEEKKAEVTVEKATAEEKDATVKALEEQKALELEIPTNTDADKKSIEEKYKNLITSVKEDKLSKDDVIGLGEAAENYIKNVKAARGSK